MLPEEARTAIETTREPRRRIADAIFVPRWYLALSMLALAALFAAPALVSPNGPALVLVSAVAISLLGLYDVIVTRASGVRVRLHDARDIPRCVHRAQASEWRSHSGAQRPGSCASRSRRQHRSSSGPALLRRSSCCGRAASRRCAPTCARTAVPRDARPDDPPAPAPRYLRGARRGGLGDLRRRA